MNRSLMLASLVVLAGCTAGRMGPGSEARLVVDVVSDHAAGVDVVALRVEVARDALFEGARVESVRSLEGERLHEGVRALEATIEPLGAVWVRVSLLDAAGRVRAERVAQLEVRAARTVVLALDAACAARVCPSEDDPDDALACVNDTCVVESCVDAATCPADVLCASDDDCATSSTCRRAACVSGVCLALDACGSSERCVADACVPTPRCGDGTCDPGVETPCACADDCGSCPAGCGDGSCGLGDDAERCPEDCGAPEARCGDAICEADRESAASCPTDCARAWTPVCGDATCEGAERCADCPECCEARGCGDGVCDADEEPCTCASDCGPCAACGDGRCDVGEACAEDCEGLSICGDGACDEAESCARCEADCGWCTGYPTRASSCDEPPGLAVVPTCAGIGGAFPSEAVHVAYYPMRVAAFEGTDLVTGARVLAVLPEGARFAVQSVRNPSCAAAPPMAPARDGLVLGYAPDLGEAGFGWVAADDLVLEEDERASCPYGPRGDGFAARLNPYAAAGCMPLACAAEDVLRTCEAAARAGPDECAGRVVDAPGSVLSDVARLHLSPDGPPSGFLHAADRVHVLYESGRAGWIFVEALASAAPSLAPVGIRGWMNATEVVR